MQASLRTVAGEDAPLDSLVPRLNRYAVRVQPGWTLDSRRVLGQYEHGTGHSYLVNSGHKRARYLRRANGTLEELDKGGLRWVSNPMHLTRRTNLRLRSGDV